MEITQGQVVKVATTKDNCVRLTVDVEKAFIPKGANLINWQDQMITIQHEGDDENNG